MPSINPDSHNYSIFNSVKNALQSAGSSITSAVSSIFNSIIGKLISSLSTYFKGENSSSSTLKGRVERGDSDPYVGIFQGVHGRAKESEQRTSIYSDDTQYKPSASTLKKVAEYLRDRIDSYAGLYPDEFGSLEEEGFISRASFDSNASLKFDDHRENDKFDIIDNLM